MKFTINFKDFNDQDRKAFFNEWEACGFYTDDLETDCPYCAPWDWADPTLTINVPLPFGINLRTIVCCHAIGAYRGIVQALEDETRENDSPELAEKLEEAKKQLRQLLASKFAKMI